MKCNNKHLLKKFIYVAIGASVVLNLFFVVCAIFEIDARNHFSVFKNKVKSKIINRDKPVMYGRWHTLKRKQSELILSANHETAIKQLESIGYLSGSRKAPSEQGVVINNKDMAYKGLNLYVSGHLPETILIDMEGNELHKWSCNFQNIVNYGLPVSDDSKHLYEFWRRAHLLENGDLLAIIEGAYCLIKLDKFSNILWIFDGKTHHDLSVDPDGKIYVLTREAKINPKYNKDFPILEDFITVLSSDGNQIKRVSILNCLENSKYASVLNKIKPYGDILHTNTLELLDGKLSHQSDAFRKGNVLISILYLDLICVVDLQKESVVWALSGLWSKQHQPTISENGNMLIYDNKGNNGKSRVIEFNPFSQEIFWVYDGTTDDVLYSSTCGSSKQLPNGNILITESDAGRALEVTPDKTIVWEFVNPHRAGENDELIASLLEVIRLGPDFPLDWLDNK